MAHDLLAFFILSIGSGGNYNHIKAGGSESMYSWGGVAFGAPPPLEKGLKE